MSIFRITCFFVLLLALVTSQMAAQTVHITNKYSSDKEEVIANVLAVQKAWQIDIHSRKPQGNTQNGFLFVRMTPEFVRGLLDYETAQIIWVEHEGELAGYIILTDMGEFFSLYINSPVRTFVPKVNLPLLEEYLIVNNVQYIEQIAVKPEFTKEKIGTTLVNAVKEISPNGLVAAVMTKPFDNIASRAFFLKSGFSTVGQLDCIQCAKWPAYQTHVFFWRPSEYPVIEIDSN